MRPNVMVCAVGYTQITHRSSTGKIDGFTAWVVKLVNTLDLKFSAH